MPPPFLCSFEVDYDETLELNTDYNTVDTGDTGDTGDTAAQPRNLDIAAEDRWDGRTE